MSEFTTVNTGATAAASDDRLQYRVAEQTGTPVMLVDPDGIVRENNRVFPFGEPWNLTVSSPNDQDFTSYQRDSESGLDYAMARHYASRSGRFMTPDPGHVGANIRDPQSWNAYTYALNDSINGIDPPGMLPCWIPFFGTCEDPAPPPQDLPCLIGIEPSCPHVPGDPQPIRQPGVPQPLPPRVVISVPMPGPSDPCKGLLQEILGLIEEIQGRYWDIVNNKLNLPMTTTNPPHPSGSVSGHQQQYRNKQRSLQNMLNKFNTNGCGGPPPSAWDWGTRAVPAPARRPVPTITTRRVAVGIGAGYVIYRGIRLIPSLAPPLWPTIPANVMIP